MDKFIVSARKYRPATFESVVGQSHITSTLQNAIVRDKLAHAYLFCGPRGVGKTTCARIVAKTINCMNRTERNEACDKCDSCRAFNDGSSFNIHEMDAASNTSVENIRSLNEQVRVLPQIGRYSVYIIDEVHMLSTSAFNAFLKTLEEPPEHVVFILATTEKHKILPTILSRCQIYDFKRITVQDVVDYLKYIAREEGVNSDDESLHMIAAKADGCMRDALSMFDKVVSYCRGELTAFAVSDALNILDYDTYFTVVSQLRSGDYQSALLKFDEVLQRGFDCQTFVGGISTHLRNVLVASNPSTIKLLEISGNVAIRFSEQSKEIDLGFIFNTLTILSSLEESLKSSLNQRLSCEIALLKVANLSGIVDLNTTPRYTLPQSGAAPAPTPAPVVAQPSAPTTVAAPQQTNAATESAPIATEPTAPIATESKTEVATPTTKPRRTPRLAGTSLKELKQELSSNTIAPEKEQTIEESYSEVLCEDSADRVLEACKEYAAKIAESKPRAAIVLEKATILNHKILLVVPSEILRDDLIVMKHDILGSISKMCGVGSLDFTIDVEPMDDNKPKDHLLVKSEDKLEYLHSKNSHLKSFMKDFDLYPI